MKKPIFILQDTKVGYYPPVVSESIPAMIRDFSTQAKDNSTMIGMYPQDFYVYHVGYFDSEALGLEVFDSPECVCKGSDYID